jgi:ribulose-5-phosphate 4-epimerase/fuculose-1-phosphate aldolase
MATGANDTLALEIAAATRLLEWRGILNYSGHISCRVPGEDAILIQRRNDSRAQLRPERLVRVSLDRDVLSEGKPPSETVIHTEIMKSRPDVQAALHCHLPIAVRFTLMKDVSIVPLLSHALRWRSGVPTHPDPSHIDTVEQGRSLALSLGPHNAALMRAHGIVLVSESVKALAIDAIHFMENAESQLEVLRAGQELAPLTNNEMDAIAEHEHREHHIGKIWDYYMGKATEADIVPREWGLDPTAQW